MAAPYRVHRLIQDLMKDPQQAARFRADPDALFDTYELAQSERDHLRKGSPDSLIALGVHPNLQMKYFRILNPPKPDDRGPAWKFLERLPGDQ